MIDIEKTTYHETGDGIWRIDSGTDYGDLWDFDVFKAHAEDYGDDDPRRERKGDWEILEAELEDREYRMVKNHDTDEFHFMFYVETDAEEASRYIDSIWEDEIDTVITETARSKMETRHLMEQSDDRYKNRLSRKF